MSSAEGVSENLLTACADLHAVLYVVMHVSVGMRLRQQVDVACEYVQSERGRKDVPPAGGSDHLMN